MTTKGRSDIRPLSFRLPFQRHYTGYHRNNVLLVTLQNKSYILLVVLLRKLCGCCIWCHVTKHLVRQSLQSQADEIFCFDAISARTIFLGLLESRECLKKNNQCVIKKHYIQIIFAHIKNIM